MSVHIYKYRSQWLCGRNVSSGINAWFFAYCAHFPGIDTLTPVNLVHPALFSIIYNINSP